MTLKLKAEKCEYTWDRRPYPGARYVMARGQCKRNKTASCGRCATHCSNQAPDGTVCEHALRRRK